MKNAIKKFAHILPGTENIYEVPKESRKFLRELKKLKPRELFFFCKLFYVQDLSRQRQQRETLKESAQECL
jgi:hypothetical protein